MTAGFIKIRTHGPMTVLGTIVCVVLGTSSVGPRPASAQSAQQSVKGPQFRLDPFWPKPLPDKWLLVDVTGVCVDAHDHVFILNHNNPTAQEEQIATVAPAVIEFDQEGNVVNSWGDRNLLPLSEPELHRGGPHGCFVDYEGNVWIAGTRDGIVQKYSHDGSKLLLQIGTRGKWDSSDGTIKGAATNSSHTLLNGPNAVAVDPVNGDVYVADGVASGNRRVVVFDRDGKFQRQWGRQATKAEAEAGMGGVFLDEGPHHLAFGNDGLLYVCDRVADRVEVFDKMGKFIRNIHVQRANANLSTVEMSGKVNAVGTVWQVAFSPDKAQNYMYVADGGDEVVWVVDRVSGQTLSSFGRPGHLAGNFTGLHMLAADSKGDIITVETNGGRRIQRFKLVRK
jgi:DNA-binding beta-propeller fold protein YncE